ncbi:NADH-quinone oxidoreductase subunit J [Jiulongibacter sediminis]|jgi:NADH-quinone oxidoreductase subunit J|uniref:NADH-quinone oxidoreductase subunit J family protein n=1 Tax=Jiulongibacter sediminis TaxID=1605367 RepID=UPI0026E93999|nr:NADH-quinone oxidoreductase subunit J [Jiulongibacter sediminis]
MEDWMNQLDWAWLQWLALGVFALGAVGGALYLFFTKNILYGAYGLLTSLISVGGLFLMNGAEFLAVSQIMVYVGGILILIMFGIMLSAKGEKKEDALKVVNVNSLVSLLFAAVMAGGLIFYSLKMGGSRSLAKPSAEQVQDLGMSLMTTQVLVLELVGVLLLIVLIGASYIAKK